MFRTFSSRKPIVVKIIPRIRAYTAPLIFMLMPGITMPPSCVAIQATKPSFISITTVLFQLAGSGGSNFL